MFRSNFHSLSGFLKRSYSSKPVHALRDTRPKSKRLTGFGKYDRQENGEIITKTHKDTFTGIKIERSEIIPDEATQYIGEKWVLPVRGRSGVAPLQEGAIASIGQPLNDEGTLFTYNFNSGSMVTMRSRFGQASMKSVQQTIDIYTNNVLAAQQNSFGRSDEEFASGYIPELSPRDSPSFYKERRFHPNSLDQVDEYKRSPVYYNSVWNREPEHNTPAVMIFASVSPGEGITPTTNVGANQWMLRRKLYELTYLFREQLEKQYMYEAHRNDQSPADGDKPLNNMDTSPVNVSILNGPLLGSGACLSLFHKYVIGTEGTSYSVPDIFAGRIPNNGNLYILTKLNEKYPGFGTWLGLTGARLTVEDMIHFDMITHYSDVPGLGEQILRRLDEHVQLPTEEQLKSVLSDITEHPDAWKGRNCRFEKLLPQIAEAFGDLGDAPSLLSGTREIPFIKDVLDHIKYKGDEVAAACFLQAMQFAKDMEVHQIMNMEYRLMGHLSSRLDQPESLRRNDTGVVHDFFEKHSEVPDIFLPEQLYMYKAREELNPNSESILSKLKLKVQQ